MDKEWNINHDARYPVAGDTLLSMVRGIACQSIPIVHRYHCTVILIDRSFLLLSLTLFLSRSQWMLEKPHDDELAITCMIPDKAFDMIRSSIADAVVSRDSMRSPLSYCSSIILYLSLHVFPSSYSSIYLYFWVYLLSFISPVPLSLFLFPIFLSIIPWPGFWHCNIPLGP